MKVRLLVTLIALVPIMGLTPCVNLHAQKLLAPSLRDAKADANQAKNKVKTLQLYQAAEPDPALRYRFWPDPADRLDDNPLPLVNRAVIISMNNRHSEKGRREVADRYNEWSKMPLDQLPKEEVREFLNKFAATALGELERAENHMRLEYDIQLDNLSASEMIATLLPEFQEMRELARMLRLRIRLAIVEERWEDVEHDVRLGFRLAEVAGHSTEFLVGRLVGFAISRMAMDSVLEAIQRPGCPNFYWALASLPETRLFETRDSIEFESVLISRFIQPVQELSDDPIGPEVSRQHIRELANEVQSLMSAGFGKGDIDAQLLSGVYVVTMADASRKILAESTDWGERAYELSAPEAVLRATHLSLARVRDRWVKWALLPPEVYDEFSKERQASMEPVNAADQMQQIAIMFTPAIAAARRAGVRTNQTRNFLLCLESLRMHAAEDDELPTSIEDLRPVPAWHDPLARGPFVYQRTSLTTATLMRAPQWPGDDQTVFHIELKKGDH